jgi:hypothetical protein
MKKLLLLTCVITIFATTGCFFPGRGGWRGRRGDAGETAPVVAVQTPVAAAPEVAARTPEVIVAPEKDDADRLEEK